MPQLPVRSQARFERRVATPTLPLRRVGAGGRRTPSVEADVLRLAERGNAYKKIIFKGPFMIYFDNRDVYATKFS